MKVAFGRSDGEKHRAGSKIVGGVAVFGDVVIDSYCVVILRLKKRVWC